MDTEAYVEEAYTGRTTRLARVPVSRLEWAIVILVTVVVIAWCSELYQIAGAMNQGQGQGQERATTGAYVVLEWGWKYDSAETTR